MVAHCPARGEEATDTPHGGGSRDQLEKAHPLVYRPTDPGRSRAWNEQGVDTGRDIRAQADGGQGL